MNAQWIKMKGVAGSVADAGAFADLTAGGIKAAAQYAAKFGHAAVMIEVGCERVVVLAAEHIEPPKLDLVKIGVDALLSGGSPTKAMIEALAPPAPCALTSAATANPAVHPGASAPHPAQRPGHWPTLNS